MMTLFTTSAALSATTFTTTATAATTSTTTLMDKKEEDLRSQTSFEGQSVCEFLKESNLDSELKNALQDKSLLVKHISQDGTREDAAKIADLLIIAKVSPYSATAIANYLHQKLNTPAISNKRTLDAVIDSVASLEELRELTSYFTDKTEEKKTRIAPPIEGSGYASLPKYNELEESTWKRS